MCNGGGLRTRTFAFASDGSFEEYGPFAQTDSLSSPHCTAYQGGQPTLASCRAYAKTTRGEALTVYHLGMIAQARWKHYELWLQTATILYNLYNLRVYDVVGIQGRLERNPERAQEFANYLEPMNHIARQVCAARSIDTFPAASSAVQHFLLCQLRQIQAHRLYVA